MRAWRTQAAAALVSVLVSSVAYAAADIPDDWRQTAYSIAAGQAGVVNAYRIEDDLMWRRIDDNRFSAFKGMQSPTEQNDWWVKLFYRSDAYPDYGGASMSQSYSSMHLGYESGRGKPRYGGTMRQGFFYLTGTSSSSAQAYTAGDVAYGSASSSLQKHGAAWYTSWEGKDSHRIESVVKVTNVRNRLSYTDDSGQSRADTYRTWIPSVGLRWYQTKFVADSFFLEPQLGISLGYVNLPGVSGTDAAYASRSTALVTGKAGLMAGKTYRLGGNPGMAYGRVEVQRDISGGLYGEGKELQSGKSVSVPIGAGRSSWYNMTVGTSYAMGRGNQIWGELTRRFGSDMERTWHVSGGLTLRWGGARKKDREEFERLKGDEHSLRLDKEEKDDKAKK